MPIVGRSRKDRQGREVEEDPASGNQDLESSNQTTDFADRHGLFKSIVSMFFLQNLVELGVLCEG